MQLYCLSWFCRHERGENECARTVKLYFNLVTVGSPNVYAVGAMATLEELCYETVMKKVILKQNSYAHITKSSIFNWGNAHSNIGSV